MYPRLQPNLEWRIIEELAKGPRTTTELEKILKKRILKRLKRKKLESAISEAVSRLRRLGLISNRRGSSDARQVYHGLKDWGYIFRESVNSLIEHFKVANILYRGNVESVHGGNFKFKVRAVLAKKRRFKWGFELIRRDEEVFEQAAKLLAESRREVDGLRGEPVEGNVEVTVLTKGFAAATDVYFALQGLPKRLRSKVNVKVELSPDKSLLEMLMGLDDEGKPAITHTTPRELVKRHSDVRGRVLPLGLGLTQSGVEVLSFGDERQIFAMESTERSALADFLRGKGYEVTLMRNHDDAVKAAFESGGTFATHTIVDSGALSYKLGRPSSRGAYSEPKLIVVNEAFAKFLGGIACKEMRKQLSSRRTPSDEEVRRAILKVVTATSTPEHSQETESRNGETPRAAHTFKEFVYGSPVVRLLKALGRLQLE